MFCLIDSYSWVICRQKYIKLLREKKKKGEKVFIPRFLLYLCIGYLPL